MPNDMYCVKKRIFLVLNFYLKLPLEVMAISVFYIFVNELNKYVFLIGCFLIVLFKIHTFGVKFWKTRKK